MLKGEKIVGTYRITMSRAPVNAFDDEFVDAWSRVLDEVASSSCTILHVRSSEKVFSAGADLKMMRAFFAGAGAGEKLVAHVKRMQDVFNRIEALPPNSAISALQASYRTKRARGLEPTIAQVRFLRPSCHRPCRSQE